MKYILMLLLLISTSLWANHIKILSAAEARESSELSAAVNKEQAYIDVRDKVSVAIEDAIGEGKFETKVEVASNEHRTRLYHMLKKLGYIVLTEKTLDGKDQLTINW